MKRLRFSLLPGFYAVSRLASHDAVPAWADGGGAPGFSSVSRSPAELSIVCPEDRVPAGVKSERAWRCLEVEGPFDFGEVGVVASFAASLAAEGIGIFVVSTFDTDYLFVKSESLERTVLALSRDGHTVILKDG